MRIVLELEGEPHAIIRALKLTLRRLLRDHGIRCKYITTDKEK